MMKKSQILAAIALAMALGVVAPIAVAENVSAAVVEGKTNQQYIDGEIAAIKAKFNNVMVYDANGVTTSYKDGYTYYGIAAGKIDAAQTLIGGAETSVANSLAGNSTSGMEQVMSDILGTAVTADFLTNTEVNTIKNTQGWRTDYAKTLELTNVVKAKLNAIKTDTTNKYTTEQVLAATNLVARVDALIDNASTAIDGVIAAAANDTVFNDVVAIAKELTNDQTIARPTTLAGYNAVVAKINAKLPQMAAYRRVAAAIAKYEAAPLNGSVAGLIDRQVKELADALWAAYNGTTPDKTIDQIADETDKGDVNAPATGIAGTAEGTATTVSIVAGLATALTALGAGVVAYRSARRK